MVMDTIYVTTNPVQNTLKLNNSNKPLASVLLLPLVSLSFFLPKHLSRENRDSPILSINFSMDKSHKVPSFSCELRIIQAQNVESIKSNKKLFVRLYLPSGSNKSIQLNTKKVSSNTKRANPFWNESFNLDCSCPQEFLESLKKESLVLELRQSKMWGLSQVVGRGEIPWKAILDQSPNMEFKEWVNLVSGSASDYDDGATLSAPQVQVEIKIRVEKENNRRRRLINDNWDECGCKHGHDPHAWCSSVDDYDIFAFGAVLEAF